MSTITYAEHTITKKDAYLKREKKEGEERMACDKWG
jgi:hypothetical protein|tara:strand:+ start:101 stop:208 length:108 start_codon:yes stop_codon:yes gene_type:complete